MTKKTTKIKEVESSIEVQYDEQELNNLTTTSSKIRYLNSKGLSRGSISKVLNIRYQWVRNVLITPLKKVEV